MSNYDPRPPKPPVPTPNCTHNCGPIEQVGVDWQYWTCRCGYGYFTREGEWISGFRVRNGHAPPRDQQHTKHQSHLYPPCGDCEEPRSVPPRSTSSLVSQEAQQHSFQADLRLSQPSHDSRGHAYAPQTPPQHRPANTPQHLASEPVNGHYYTSPGSYSTPSPYRSDTFGSSPPYQGTNRHPDGMHKGPRYS